MPQKMLIRKTEELAFASSSALVYCIAERSVLRILLPQAILNRFDGMNRLDIIAPFDRRAQPRYTQPFFILNSSAYTPL